MFKNSSKVKTKSKGKMKRGETSSVSESFSVMWIILVLVIRGGVHSSRVLTGHKGGGKSQRRVGRRS